MAKKVPLGRVVLRSDTWCVRKVNKISKDQKTRNQLYFLCAKAQRVLFENLSKEGFLKVTKRGRPVT
jgi:hypothetical protein